MQASFLQSILSNRLTAPLIALAIGVFVARLIHDMVSTHDRRMRPLLIASVANISFLALIWACEFAFQKSGWVPAAVAWIPQHSFLPLSIILVILALARRSSLCAWINAIAAVFVAGILMDAHFATASTLPVSNSLKVMTVDVDGAKAGAASVAALVKQVKPDVFCLQGSPKNLPIDSLQRTLPKYRFVQNGGMTIGSTYPIESEVSTPKGCQGAAAVITGRHEKFAVVDFRIPPCDAKRAMHDPGGYFAKYTEESNAQARAVLSMAKSIKAPLLVCGDLNAPPQAASSHILTNKLQDAFAQAGTGYGFTAPANMPYVRTDRILVSTGLNAEEISTVHTSASTHLAVVADVAFSARK